MDFFKQLINFVILASSLVALVSGQCTFRDQCSCTMADGGLIDLTSLGNQNQLPAFPDTYAMDGYFYSYNPCYSFIEGACTNAAACQIIGDQSAQYQIGDANSAMFDFDGINVHVKYSSTDSTGLTRNLDVTLVCDMSGQPASFQPQGETGGLDYAFTLTTICACPNGCGAPPPTDPFTTTAGPGPRPDNSGSNDDGGISTGSILCIVMASNSRTRKSARDIKCEFVNLKMFHRTLDA
ncbi:uncharacterized protein LOC125666854 isoform X2 [Ostrea edulis]|uniref:uncharacterized protein LOC125666854 isoform X2 n=1 Tax=Ostrea edulis TaxID=37623 RepID=UPI0024AFB9D1|nr:uncharacterized protein LOC125666854 isoform X2 [Ostrea edulis]